MDEDIVSWLDNPGVLSAPGDSLWITVTRALGVSVNNPSNGRLIMLKNFQIIMIYQPIKAVIKTFLILRC